MKMRSAKTLYKQDSFFDIYQKARRDSENYRQRKNSGDASIYLNQREMRRESEISAKGSLYLTELVNDLKETIVNFDDDIFANNTEKKESKNPKIKKLSNRLSAKVKININLIPKSSFNQSSNRYIQGSLTNRNDKYFNLTLSNKRNRKNK